MKIHILTLLSVTMAVAGCQTSPKIQTEYNPEADFSTYAKFAVAPLPTSIPGGDPGLVLRTGKIVQSAVVSDLEGKGFEELEDMEAADFVVKLTGKVVPKTDLQDFGYTMQPAMGWYGYYRPYYYERDVYVDQYEEGTLIVEVYDVATKELVWVGWGVARRTSDIPDPERIRSVVADILADFPPQ